ncbi:TonB-dependent receptor [Marinicella sp. S1101]|uniref:TonB-dependent receptor family protein n=1 Tax=Marinicella marina TaxID=2996016 RepID=UPI002260FEEE|nr:TonB-dependent receptor [Marinicella marina]MCX7553577.1 TonB-dependent receptor [Marinicella marina]MDJ1140201.1 TonB-dependent receptor [Marinicella marina]
MKPATLMMVLLLSSSHSLRAQTIQDEASDQDQDVENVARQPNLVVSENVPDIPAPLQSEAKKINAWSGSASINTDEYWRNQRAANIKDILDFVPGVFAQQRNGAESARISIRGSGLGRQFQGGGLLLLQDGVPLNTADGSFDFQAVDPWLIDYVTVFRGGNGMASGGSTLGGVINLGTTLPDLAQNNELRLSAGSFGSQRGMVAFTTGNENQAFRLRTSLLKQDGFRIQNQQRSNRFDLQHLIKGQSNWQHRIGLYHLNTYAELPSSLSQTLIDEDPRQSRGFNIFGNFNRDMTLTRLSYQLANEHLKTTIYWSQKRLNNPVFTYINRDSDDAGINLNYQRGNHQLLLTTQSGDQDERRRENEAGLPGAERLTRFQQAQTTTAAYSYQLPILSNTYSDQLTLDLGLQAVWAEREIKESFPESITSNKDYSQLNPRIAVRYQPQANKQWFTSLSRSFEAPTFAELNNGNQPGFNNSIKAQSADTFEVGTRGFTETFNWDMSLYYSRIEDEFIRFRFPDGATRTTNAEQSIHWGLESAVSWRLNRDMISSGDELTLSSNYQYNQFNLDDDPTFNNNRIPGIPEHYVLTRLEYLHPSGWRISPNIEWVPSAYYVDLANSVKTQNYLLTGLSVTYTQTNGLSWFFDAKNLNDQTYISTTLPIPDAGGSDGNYFYSGEGRAFYAGLTWAF